MKHSFITKGTCSKAIDFEIDESGRVQSIKFEDGCDGNLKGLAKLAEGRQAAELIPLLSGIKCGRKKTSCPDQLAKALKKISG